MPGILTRCTAGSRAQSDGHALKRGIRTVLPLLALILAASAVRADEFVDVLGSSVWARKGGLACDTADAAASGGGFFSNCLRLPIAMRVVLIDIPDETPQVYRMRIVGAGNTPKFAWFTRESLTNNPTPDQFRPDP